MCSAEISSTTLTTYQVLTAKSLHFANKDSLCHNQNDNQIQRSNPLVLYRAYGIEAPRCFRL
jgi:hypothetical protein